MKALLVAAMLALPFLSVTRPASAAAPAKPINLVFILTDNQGAWTLGCYGNQDIRTPHIDRLAAHGVRFTRASAAIQSALRLALHSSPVSCRRNTASTASSIRNT